MWLKLLNGVDDDQGYGITVDANDNAVLVGRSDGNLDGEGNIGMEDVFVHSLAANDGSALWTEQFGTALRDEGWGIALAPNGVFFIVGFTYGNLGGANAGGADVFLAALEP